MKLLYMKMFLEGTALGHNFIAVFLTDHVNNGIYLKMSCLTMAKDKIVNASRQTAIIMLNHT